MFAAALIFAALLAVVIASSDATSAPVTAMPKMTLDFTYHNYSRMTNYLKKVEERYPDIATLYTIGTSVRGQELWVMELSTAARDAPLVPNVKLVANIHGNEAVGRELLLHLVQELTTQVGADKYITWLLNNSRVHLLPSLNPDGFQASVEGNCEGMGRLNSKGFDLNRNFPDHFSTNSFPTQPETEAVQKWLRSRNFVLSGGLHGGAVVASYPYDNLRPSENFQSNKESLSPDDDVFRHLALVYSTEHSTMHTGTTCKGEKKENAGNYPNGIVNGAKWYTLTGGMQDYNYFEGGCMEVTLEVSCCKYPRRDILKDLWVENKKALLRYLGQAQRGIRGIVSAKDTGLPIKGARLQIDNREVGFNTTGRGEFWRILLPGGYRLHVTKDGYERITVPFTVPEVEDEEYPSPVRLQVNMSIPGLSTEGPGLSTMETSSYTTLTEFTDHDYPMTVAYEVDTTDGSTVLLFESAAIKFGGDKFILVLAFVFSSCI